MPDVGAVGRALAELVSRLGGRPRRAALVIPDVVAKVSLLRFEKVPSRSADLLELMRWQMRKSVPFPMEQAVLTFSAGSPQTEAGQEFIVSAARRDIIEEYEGACALAGLHAGQIDIATFAIINGVLATQAPPSNDWLLVHTTGTYTSLAVLRGPRCDLLPEPGRGRRRRARGRRAPDGDVLRGSTQGWRLQPSAAGRAAPSCPAGPTRCAAASKSGWASRWKRSIRATRRHSSIASAPRRNCSTRWRRSSGFSCAREGRPDACCVPTFRPDRSTTSARSGWGLPWRSLPWRRGRRSTRRR